MTDAVVSCICSKQDAVSAAAVTSFKGDINAPSRLCGHDTPLMAAVSHSKLETVHALGQRGDVDPAAGVLAFFIMQPVPRRRHSCSTAVDMATALLEAFPTMDLNAPHPVSNHFPLCQAVTTADVPLLRLLLDKGAHVRLCKSCTRSLPIAYLSDGVVAVFTLYALSERAVWMRACVRAAMALSPPPLATPLGGAVPQPPPPSHVVACALADRCSVAIADSATHHLLGEYALMVTLFLEPLLPDSTELQKLVPWRMREHWTIF